MVLKLLTLKSLFLVTSKNGISSMSQRMLVEVLSRSNHTNTILRSVFNDVTRKSSIIQSSISLVLNVSSSIISIAYVNSLAFMSSISVVCMLIVLALNDTLILCYSITLVVFISISISVTMSISNYINICSYCYKFISFLLNIRYFMAYGNMGIISTLLSVVHSELLMYHIF